MWSTGIFDWLLWIPWFPSFAPLLSKTVSTDKKTRDVEQEIEPIEEQELDCWKDLFV
jgi:hypothetical protein